MRLFPLAQNGNLAGALALALAALMAMTVSGCEEDRPSFMKKGGGDSSSSFFLAKDEDIITDQATGLMIVRNVLNVNFSPKASKETVDSIVKSVNGEIVGYDYSVNFYQIRIPGASFEQTIKAKHKLLREFKEVEMASNTPVSVHQNPYYVK